MFQGFDILTSIVKIPTRLRRVHFRTPYKSTEIFGCPNTKLLKSDVFNPERNMSVVTYFDSGLLVYIQALYSHALYYNTTSFFENTS